jgi:hypothetical protein
LNHPNSTISRNHENKDREPRTQSIDTLCAPVFNYAAPKIIEKDFDYSSWIKNRR